MRAPARGASGKEAAMFCPQCGAEYREGVASCKDCGVALVATLSPEPDEPEWVDLVTVLRTSDEAQLTVAKSLLEAEGIRCLLKSAGVQGIVDFGQLSGTSLAMNLIELRVRSDDAEAARELLAAQDLSFEETEEAGPGEP
jgi:hypothetical protein